MARSSSTIYQSILSLIAGDPALATLNSASATAEYKLIASVMARLSNQLEQLQDQAIAQLQAIADRAEPGTANWYAQRCLEFQYSATANYYLTIVNGVVQYNVINVADRIVTRVAVSPNTDGSVLIKVAKGSVPSLTQLTAPELVSINGYFSPSNGIGFAGVPVTVVSLPADLIRYNLTVYYDSSQNLAILRPLVEAAIENYALAIDFGGIFSVLAAANAPITQGVPGVKRMGITSILVNGVAVPQEVRLPSGYSKVDPAFPLSTTITYVPV
jgi:hypothetical protein